MKRLPPGIEYLINDRGAFIEVESLVDFLRSDDIPEEYKVEAAHLKNLASYLETELAEVLSNKRLLAEPLDTEKPN